MQSTLSLSVPMQTPAGPSLPEMIAIKSDGLSAGYTLSSGGSRKRRLSEDVVVSKRQRESPPELDLENDQGTNSLFLQIPYWDCIQRCEEPSPLMMSNPIFRLQVMATMLADECHSDDWPEWEIANPEMTVSRFIQDLVEQTDIWLWNHDDIRLLLEEKASAPSIIRTAVTTRVWVIFWIFLSLHSNSDFFGIWGIVEKYNNVGWLLPNDFPRCGAFCRVSTNWIKVAVRLYLASDILSACHHLGICPTCIQNISTLLLERESCVPKMSVPTLPSLQQLLGPSQNELKGPPAWLVFLLVSREQDFIDDGTHRASLLEDIGDPLCTLSIDAFEWIESRFPRSDTHWMERYPQDWRWNICRASTEEWSKLITESQCQGYSHATKFYTPENEIRIKWYAMTTTSLRYLEGATIGWIAQAVTFFQTESSFAGLGLAEPSDLASLLSTVKRNPGDYYHDKWYQWPLHFYIPPELAFEAPQQWLTCANLPVAPYARNAREKLNGIERDSEARRLFRLVQALQSGESWIPVVDHDYNIVNILADYYGCQERCLKLLAELHLPTGFTIDWLLAMLRDDVLTACAQLQTVLDDENLYRDLLGRTGREAHSLLNLMHQILDFPGMTPKLQSACTKAIIRLSRRTGLHPECLVLRGLQKLGRHPIAAGAFGEVWRGIVRGQEVSVKVVKVYLEEDVEALLKDFYREAILWSQLSHPNILPLYGIYFLDDMRSRLCLVSPWQTNGNVPQYLKKRPNADRFHLLLDVAQGLEYLHGKKIVHGDLKGLNILVTSSHRACIMDFGLSSIADSQILKWNSLSSSAARGGTGRWQAPEILNGGANSFAGDVYAFACVCCEAFTGLHPFPELRNDGAVVLQVVSGARPTRPESAQLSDDMWKLMQDCWKGEPQERPTAASVVERIRRFPELANRDPSSNEWDESFPKSLRTSLRSHPLIPSEDELKHIFDAGNGPPAT